MAAPWLVITATLEIPMLLDPDGPANSRVNRIHTRVVKQSMEQTLRRYHKELWPDHFEPGEQDKYKLTERKPVTDQIKKRRYGHTTKLVKTGRSRNNLVRRRWPVTLRGSAGAGVVTATMRMRLRKPIRTNKRASDGMSLRDILDELSRWAPDEEKTAAEWFGEFYADGINREIKSQRVRKRIGTQLAAMGVT